MLLRLGPPAPKTHKPEKQKARTSPGFSTIRATFEKVNGAQKRTGWPPPRNPRIPPFLGRKVRHECTDLVYEFNPLAQCESLIRTRIVMLRFQDGLMNRAGPTHSHLRRAKPPKPKRVKPTVHGSIGRAEGDPSTCRHRTFCGEGFEGTAQSATATSAALTGPGNLIDVPDIAARMSAMPIHILRTRPPTARMHAAKLISDLSIARSRGVRRSD